MKRLHEENEQHDEQRWGQHLANAVDDLVGVQREIVGCREKDRRIDELSESELVLTEEGANADLK